MAMFGAFNHEIPGQARYDGRSSTNNQQLTTNN
jgi:hypothetical protein